MVADIIATDPPASLFCAVTSTSRNSRWRQSAEDPKTNTNIAITGVAPINGTHQRAFNLLFNTMTPPLTAAMDPSRKRVEWSDNVTSTETAGPTGEDGAQMWDTEAGESHVSSLLLGLWHITSYYRAL